MATLSDLARGWMQKGDSDRLTAERILLGPGPYDTACFHTQQAVELLSHGEVDVLPYLWGAKTQDYPFFRDSSTDQLDGNASFRSVPLNPELALNYVNMDEAAVNTLALIPAYIYEEIPVTGPVKDVFGLNAAVSIRNPCVFP